MTDTYEADTVVGRTVTIEERRSKLLDSLEAAAEKHDIPYEPDPQVTITKTDVDSGKETITLQRSTLLELCGAASEVDIGEDRLDRVTDLLERHKYTEEAELLEAIVGP